MIVTGGWLAGAWVPAARADDAPEPEGEAEPVRLQGTVMPRFHVVDERGAEPSDTDRQAIFVRRARAQLTFEPDPRVRLVVEAELMDPAEPVRDAYARYRFDRKLEVTAGWFKRPFGATELDGVWDLYTSERGLSSDLLDGEALVEAEEGADVPLTSQVAGRDAGAMVAGRWKKALGLRWAAGVYDGHGDGGVGARLSISPGPLTLGVSAGWNRAPDPGLRDGAAAGLDATLEGRWAFVRAEAFVGQRMPVEHDTTGDVIHAQWAGGFLLAVAKLAIPGTCVVLSPGGKLEVLDRTTDGTDDELLLVSPLLRADLGPHFRLLVEGNFLVAGDNADVVGAPVVVQSFVLQLGARV